MEAGRDPCCRHACPADDTTVTLGSVTAALVALHAATETPPLVVHDCPTVDIPRLEQQLTVELDASDGADTSKRRLHLVCAPESTTLEVSEVGSEAVWRRTLDGPLGEGEERTLALHFGELWATAASQRPAHARKTPAPKPRPEPRATAQLPPPPPWQTFVTATGGFALRSLATEPLSTGRASLGVRQRVHRRVALRLAAFIDVARTQRSLGRLTALAVGATASPMLVAAMRGRFRFWVGPELAAGWGTVFGTASGNGIGSARVSAVTADAGAVLMPSWQVGRIDLGVALSGGYRLRQPEGIVNGTTAFSLGGPWVAVDVRVAAGVLRARASGI